MTNPTPEPTDAELLADIVVRDVCDLPDYSSPPDQPNLLSVTCEELHGIVVNALALERPGRTDGERMDWLEKRGFASRWLSVPAGLVRTQIDAEIEKEAGRG